MVNHLRNKVEPDPYNPRFIHTDRNLGYRLGELDEEKAQEISLLNGRLAFNRDNHHVIVDGVLKPLSPQEHALLLTLSDHTGEVLTREFLLDNAWPPNDSIGPTAVDISIRRLRVKIQVDPDVPIIFSERSGGYRLGELQEAKSEAMDLRAGVTFFRRSNVLMVDGQKKYLTQMEKRILLMLYERAGQTVERSEFINEIWDG